MNNRKFQFAAAAIIICCAAFIVISPHGATVAWAQVSENVLQTRSFSYQLNTFVTDSETDLDYGKTMEMNIYLSADYGFRMDILAQDNTVSWFVPPEEETITIVVPKEKKAVTLPFSKEQAEQKSQNDPREYIQQFMNKEYVELGTKMIDGHRVEGIQVDNPPVKQGKPLENSIGTLWVDVQNDLPVQLEICGNANDKYVKMTMDFRWDIPLDAALFIPSTFE